MQPAVTGKNKLHTDTFDRRPDAKRHASPHKCRELRQHKTHEATPPSFGILRHARGTVSANRGDAVLCFCRFRVVFYPPAPSLPFLTLEQVDRSSSPPHVTARPSHLISFLSVVARSTLLHHAFPTRIACVSASTSLVCSVVSFFCFN